MSWFTAELKRFTPNITKGFSTGTTKGAEFIDWTAKGGMSLWESGWEGGTGMKFTDWMTMSQNIFSSSHGYVDKFRTGLGEELHKMGESFDIGCREIN